MENEIDPQLEVVTPPTSAEGEVGAPTDSVGATPVEPPTLTDSEPVVRGPETGTRLPAHPSAPVSDGGRLPAGRQGFGSGRGGRGGGQFGGRGGRGGMRRGGDRPKSEFDQKVLEIARVSRVTKGGKRFSFRATIVIGDGKGRVGVGMAKGKDVAQSVQKAVNQAKKYLFMVPLKRGTIPYQVEAKYNSAVVILKPGRGGVKAGGPVRVVAKLAGITGLTGKLIERTNNKLNIAQATIKALKMIRPLAQRR